MRRLTSILGILLIIGLVLTLFWRVYLHHQATDPDDADETVVAHVKIAVPSL